MTKAQTKDKAPALFADMAPNPKPVPAARQKAEPKPAKKTEVATVHRMKPPAVAEPKNLLALIANVLTSPAFDVAKAKEVLAMQWEIERRDDARAFNMAMLAAQDELPRIVKDKMNLHTKAKYPTLENVSASIDKIVRKNGFVMSWGTADSPLKDHYRIVCDLSHSAGDVRRYHVDLKADTTGSQGTKNKTDIQGVASTISFGRRILKILMFDLAVVGEDKDGNRPRREAPDDVIDVSPNVATFITTAQHDKLVDAIAASGATPKSFCAAYRIDKVTDLPASLFDTAIKACADRKAREGR